MTDFLFTENPENYIQNVEAPAPYREVFKPTFEELFVGACNGKRESPPTRLSKEDLEEYERERIAKRSYYQGEHLEFHDCYQEPGNGTWLRDLGDNNYITVPDLTYLLENEKETKRSRRSTTFPKRDKKEQPKKEGTQPLVPSSGKGLYLKFYYYLGLILEDERDQKLLAFLISWQEGPGKGNEEFYCRTEDIETLALMSKGKQERSFRVLRDRGYIKIELKGQPAKRWITIEWDAIDADVLAAQIH